MENFTLKIEEKTAYITINRPDKMNALNRATLSELSLLLKKMKKDKEVRGVIITGAGDKAFVAGADISEFKGLSEREAFELSSWGHKEVMDEIYNFPKPVIAAINGYALGGGLELAMACHIRVAVEEAKLGLPEVSLGLIPGYGGTQRLPALIGRGRALEMILTGDMVSATNAYEWGLVNHIVEKENLLDKCLSILKKMYTRSPLALTSAIHVVNYGLMNPAKGADEEMKVFSKAYLTEDFKEGVAAFLEKRKPDF
ncbi:enoyl-CoA hydratase-related protein [Sphingobacterium sp. UT-1RO-CII-1]|uniref:enoyl-CoA hydratase-related protein n=1 Tax=Sphingobacterium sp. UT-1RO-CII-1 TaxID=2995225 RepID=UPI00227C1D42|nr:enoyl-CoA hydratase-related protein [Sphingobacterium sp. UT-1RO-CII-1]MCY4778492.1 enoyl-CoA hydratase-related protein [Sphingobacterium sp. UT-1RO-CII-1]